MKDAELGANESPSADPIDQIVVPPTGVPCASVQRNAAPPHSCTSMPRCRRYQDCSAAGSFALKKMPPMPVTRSMCTSHGRMNEKRIRETRGATSMATLNERQAALFTDRNWGVIATIREDGSPHATPVWIDYDGEKVLVNSAHGRTKVKNIERDPRATVTVLPAANQQAGYVMVSGTATIVEEGALEHINMLARKYLGEDKYPYLGPGERRVIIQIDPERIDGFGAGG